LFAINVVCALTGALLILPWVGNLIVWLLAMIRSEAVTNEYNAIATAAEDRRVMERRQEQEDRELEVDRSQRAAKDAEDARKAAALVQAQREDEVRSQRVRGAEVAQRYARLTVLETTGVLSQAEVAAERKKIVANAVANGWTDEDLTEFLGPFADLVSGGTLDGESLQLVKALYASLKKGRPSS
jgi:hypothetical protein